MNRWKKILLSILAIGLLALIGLAVAAHALFDEDAVKKQLTQMVEKKTGRELSIEGPLELSLFPWLGVKTSELMLSDLEKFQDRPMARLSLLEARVKLLPLLSKRVEIGQVTIEGLELYFVKAADGEANWQFGKSANTDTSADESSEDATASLSLDAINISNSSISIRDLAQKSLMTISDFSFSSGAIKPGQAFDFETAFTLAIDNDEPISFSLAAKAADEWTADVLTLLNPTLSFNKAQLTLLMKADQLAYQGDLLNAEQFSVEWKDNSLESLQSGTLTSVQATWDGAEAFSLSQASVKSEYQNQTLKLQAPTMNYLMDADQLTADSVNLDWGVVKATLDVKAKNVVENMSAEGRVKTEPFALRELLAAMDTEIPNTADKKVLGPTSINSRFSYNQNGFGLQQANIKMDDSNIRGDLSVQSTTPTSLAFDLTIDSIDLDRYLEPATSGAAINAVSADTSAERLPVELLQSYSAKGELAVASMKAYGIQTTDTAITINLANGKLMLFPIRAKLFGGSYSGNIGLDVMQDPPLLSLDESLNAVQFAPLSEALYGPAPLEGKLTGNVKLTARGHHLGQWLSTASGSNTFNMDEAVYQGTNLTDTLLKNIGKVMDVPYVPQPNNATKLDLLKGSSRVEKGVLYADKIEAAVPFFSLNGNGQLNLMTNQLNMKMKAKLRQGQVGEEKFAKWAGYEIPVTVAGTTENLQVDTQALVKDLGKMWLKMKLGGKFLPSKPMPDPDNSDNPDAETTEPQTPEEKKEALKDELDKKVKDKLKDLFGSVGD